MPEKVRSLHINVSDRNPFHLTLQANGKQHVFSIEAPETYGKGAPIEALQFLQTVMLSHLIAPHLPQVIYTNFQVLIPEFLTHLYAFYGQKPPKIRKERNQATPIKSVPQDEVVDTLDYANAHSGGLDSSFRIAQMLSQQKRGMAVHLRNLNLKGNAYEARASKKQSDIWKILYKEIVLKNSSGNNGYDTMRTRDMVLALMVAIESFPYAVNTILIEGGMIDDPAACHFTENTQSWVMFNQLLQNVGIHAQVEGIDPGDIKTVGKVITLEKQLNLPILSLVQNCFSAPFQVPNNRRKWERETPNIATHSPSHWCGSCAKCRRMTLGRIVFHDPHFESVPQSEVTFFVNDTYRWMKLYPQNVSLLSTEFLNYLKSISS